VKKNRK